MLISDYYRQQNKELHQSGERFGHRGHRHLPKIRELMVKYKCSNVLDYGCGKATLQRDADFPVVSYDPAIEKHQKDPSACDLLVCTDVLEHIEQDFIHNVLQHMKAKMNKAGYLVINTDKDNSKTLPDGTNPHKLIKDSEWWTDILSEYFDIEKTWERGNHLFVVIV